MYALGLEARAWGAHVPLTLRWVASAVFLLSGCVLHAVEFLPRTGRYVYTIEESPDGGDQVQREELFRVLVVTTDRGPTRASVQVSKSDAGQGTLADRDGNGSVDPIWRPTEAQARAAVVVVSPVTGELLDDSSPAQVLLPERVITGSQWRANPGDENACAIDGRVTAVVGTVAHVAYDLTCGGTTAPLVGVSWQVGRGLVENRSPDGGFVVRFTPE